MPSNREPIDRKALAQRVVEHQGENPLAMLDQALSFMPEDKVRVYQATKRAEWGEVDPDAIADVLIHRLHARRYPPHLIYLDQGDTLDAEQVQVLIDGENIWESSAWQYLADNMSDEERRRAEEFVKEELCESDEERDVLDADIDLLDQVAQEVTDADNSNWVQDFINATHNMLFRYGLDHEVEGWDDEDGMDSERTALAAALGVDVVQHRQALDDVLNEVSHYGGSVEVIWYGDPAAAIALASPESLLDPDNDYKPFPQAPTLGTVTFTDVHLLVRNGLYGAGMDVKFPGRLTLPWVAGRVSTDTAGPGYSWTSIAGPYEPAYAADFFTQTPAQQNLAAARAYTDAFMTAAGR